MHDAWLDLIGFSVTPDRAMNDDAPGVRPSEPWIPTSAVASAASPAMLRWFALVARGAAAVAVGIGAVTFVEWAIHISRQADPIASLRRATPLAAVLSIGCGIALALRCSASAGVLRAWMARAASVASAALAFGILVEDLIDAGVDAMIVGVHVLLPSAPSSGAFLLTALAILSMDVRPRWGPAPAEILAVVAAMIALVTLGGYVFGAVRLYASIPLAHIEGMAIHTAAAVLTLAGGTLLARPSSGLMAIVTSPLVGGQVVRRMLPLLLAIPALAFLGSRAQRAGLYAPPGAAVFESAGCMIVALAITLAVGRSLNSADVRRRRMEDENREWKRFFERACFGVAFTTPEGRFWRVNEAFARMLGYSVDELRGMSVADLFPIAEQPAIRARLLLSEEYGHRRWATHHMRKDGTVFPVVIDLTIIRDERGKILYRAAYVQDISEEKAAEEARARLAALVESADDAIIAKALDGTVLAWNRAAERIYGYPAEEAVGRNIIAVVPEDRRAEREMIRAKVLSGETVVGLETVRLRKDGARIPVALTLSPIRDSSGRIIGSSTIARDISQQQRLEQERQEWASLVAHELRQPAAAIRFGVELLASSEGPTKERALDRIRRASDRLDRMIQDLLDVSRTEAHRLVVKPERVSVPALIAEVVEGAPHIARRCEVEIAEGAEEAWADAQRIMQVLSNLLSNADKYSYPETTIDVRVARAGGMVEVSVSNAGQGIAEGEIPKLFARFSRTETAHACSTPGLGLGLYICRGLIEAQGGKLWVESVPGEVTHFRFTLPGSSPDEGRAA